MSANIYRDTATSAIWNVTYRPWLTTLTPILISVSPQAGERPRLRRLAHRQRPHEITEVVGKRMELKADGIGGKGAA